MRILLLLLLSCTLFAGTLSAATESLPEGKLVIVVKDYEVLKEAAPAAAKPAPKKYSITSRQDWHERAAAWWERTTDWVQEQAGELLFFLVGVAISFGVVYLLSLLIRKLFILRWKEKERFNFLRRLHAAFHRPTACFLCCLGIFLSAQPLLKVMPRIYSVVWLRLLLAALAICTIWGIFRLIGLLDEFFQRRAERTPGRHMDSLLIDLIRKTVKVVVTVIAVFFVAQNIFELNITSLLAGAGVVGLAIAFAAQETIANVFGSIMIILDKPFAVGERVKIGAIDGSVESVGLRSTEVRSLDGNLFSVPNRQVADGVIENISRRPNIKYPFSIALTYDTPPEKMEEACKILHEILDSHPGFDTARQPPLVFFTDYKDWSLNISVIVWFNTRDFLLSQKWKHEINLEILRRFNAAKLKFARPASTAFLAGDPDYPPVSGSVPVSGR